MKNVFKNIGILIITILLSLILADAAGKIYFGAFPKESAGSFVGSKALVGIPLAYIFFLTLIFTSFGGEKKYWWIGILLIPDVAFELYFDLAHIYFPVVLALLGWGIGFGISKLIKK